MIDHESMIAVIMIASFVITQVYHGEYDYCQQSGTRVVDFVTGNPVTDRAVKNRKTSARKHCFKQEKEGL